MLFLTVLPRKNGETRVTPDFWVQAWAGLTSQNSFHGEVCRSGRLLLSIPLVQLCAAHTPNPRRARFRALRLRCAPGIDSASLHSTFANCETNVFYWPAKAKFFTTKDTHEPCRSPPTPPNSPPC